MRIVSHFLPVLLLLTLCVAEDTDAELEQNNEDDNNATVVAGRQEGGYKVVEFSDSKCRYTLTANHCISPEGDKLMNRESIQQMLRDGENDHLSPQELKSIIHREVQDQKNLEEKMESHFAAFQQRVSRLIRKLDNNLRDIAASCNSQVTGAPITGGDTVCPSGFEGMDTWISCYKFSNFAATFSVANEYCGALGGKLLSIETTRENYIVKFMLQNNPGKLTYV